MSKDENSKQFDEDIEKCRQDVLRLRDIIPGATTENNGKSPQKEKEHRKPAQQQEVVKVTQTADKANPQKVQDSIPIPIKSTPPKDAAGQTQDKMKIPRFDLAEEIMAEHRKKTAAMRKRPGQKIEPAAEVPIQKQKAAPIRQSIAPPESSQEDKIISEIVARDIERLCRGN